MNIELARQFVDQLLTGTPALNQKEVGAKDCPKCRAATWNHAGDLARRMTWSFTEGFVESNRRLPTFQDVKWTNASEIIDNWDMAIRAAHGRHAVR